MVSNAYHCVGIEYKFERLNNYLGTTVGSAKERRTEIQRERERERDSGQIFNELRLLHPPLLRKALNLLTKVSFSSS